MKGFAVRRFRAIAASAWLSLCLPQQGVAIPAAKDTWIRVQSPSFTLISDAHPEVATEAAQILECFRASVELRAHSPTQEAYVPTTVIVFENDAAFRPYKIMRNGEPAPYIGMFTPTPFGNFIAMTINRDRDPYSTVLHEYTHWMLERNNVQVPLWLHEGMAEFFSTFRIKGDKAEIGRPIDDHVEWLKHTPLFPLPKLFVIDHSSRDWDESSRRGLFYAEAWVLYHYLNMGRPELGPKLEVFLESLNATANVNQAWKDAFGMGYEPIEAGLRQYVLEERLPTLSVPLNGPGRDESAQVEQLPRAALLTTLGEYMLHVTPWQAAEARIHLEAAVQADPAYAPALAALASLMVEQGESVRAEALFQRAVEHSRNDDEPFFRWGTSKVRRFVQEHRDDEELPETLPPDLLSARELLVQAVGARPNRTETFVNLGITYLFDPGEVGEGVSALEAARRLAPARMDVAYYLVVLCLRQGARAAAAALVLDVMSRSLSRDWLQRAVVALEEDTVRLYNTAVDSYNAGDVAAAQSLLKQLEHGVTNVEMAKAVTAFREKLAARADGRR